MSLPSRAWIDHELPLGGAQVTESVSAPASITGSIPLGYADRDQIREWGAMIVAEQDGRDPVAAIVDAITTDGDNLRIEAGGFSMYPTGMPWTDAEFSSTSVDPLDVVRLIWMNLQAKPAGALGVVVDGAKSTVRLGVPEDPKLTAAKAAVAMATTAERAAKATYEAAVRTQAVAKKSLLATTGRPTSGLILNQDSAPSGDKRSVKNLWLDKNDGNKAYIWNAKTKKWAMITTPPQAIINSRFAELQSAGTVVANTKKGYDLRKKETSAAKSKQSDIQGGEANPFMLTWWDTHDLGGVIDDLARNTPFEYREKSEWSGEALTHRLEIGVPVLGSRRSDLRFEIGVNVTAPPPLNERDYASEVLVLGAGEGRAMVRATTTGNPGRVRRAVVVERKDLTKTAAASIASKAAIAARKAEWDFDSLQVLDHELAPYGSFRAGDQIPVVGDAGWKQLDTWVRVLDITTDCVTGAMDLKVEAT